MSWARSISAMPRSMASDGSWGVEGTLWNLTSPARSSIMVKSVKVPPTSMPILYMQSLFSGLF